MEEIQTFEPPKPCAPGAFSMPLGRVAWLVCWALPTLAALAAGAPIGVSLGLAAITIGGALPTRDGYIYQVTARPFQDLVVKLSTARTPTRLFADPATIPALGLTLRRVVVTGNGVVSLLESGRGRSRKGTYWLVLRSAENPHTMPLDARQVWATQLTSAFDDLGTAGVRNLSVMQLRLPYDPTGNQQYLANRLHPGFPPDSTLYDNLMESLDPETADDLWTVLAFSLPHTVAWGGRQPPQVMTSEQYTASKFYGLLTLISQRLGDCGYQVDELPPLDYTALLGALLDPSNAMDIYQRADDDRQRPPGTAPLLVQQGPWPQTTMLQGSSLQLDGSYLGFLEVTGFGSNPISADGFDGALSTPPVCGAQCMPIRLEPQKARTNWAKWRLWYLLNRHQGRVYDPTSQKRLQEAVAEADSRAWSPSSFDANVRVLVMASASQPAELDEVIEQLRRYYSARHIGVRRVRGSRQLLALRIILGIPDL